MMKKILLVTAAIMAVTLLAGCPDDGGGSGPGTGPIDNTVWVQSIRILVDGVLVSGTQTLHLEDVKTITAQVTPADTDEPTTYTLSIGSTPATVATLVGGTLTAVGKGSFTLVATSDGKNASGSTVQAQLPFSIKLLPSQIENEFAVYNQKTNATSELPAAGANGRIEIFNNYTDASYNGPSPVDGTGNGWVRNNTFVYLQRPIKMEKDDKDAWIPYGIRAQMRITGAAEGLESEDAANLGVTIGIMTDPEDAQGDSRHQFVGLRSALSGQKRGFRGRAGDTSSGSLTSFVNASSAPETVAPTAASDEGKLLVEMEKADSDSTKTDGYKEQEYIYEVIRLRPDFYLIRMYLLDGTRLFTGRMDNSNGIVLQMQDPDEYLYLGFMVAGVKVEIANIYVLEGIEDNPTTNKDFELVDEVLDPIATSPTTIQDEVNRVIITTPKYNSTEGVDFNGVLAALPSMNFEHQLTAVAYPLSADQTITWSDNADGDVASVDNAGLVTFIGAEGTFTVTATSANGKTATYKFVLEDKDPEVTEVIISGSATVIMGHDTRLAVEVIPFYTTDASVTWTIESGDDKIEIAEEEATEGKYIYVNGLALGTATVKVSSNYAGVDVTDTFEIEVVGHKGQSYTWNFAEKDDRFYQTWSSVPDGDDTIPVSGIVPSATGALSAWQAAVTIDDVEYAKRIRMAGAANSLSIATGTFDCGRALKFDVLGSCTIKVAYANAGQYNATTFAGRTLMINAAKNVASGNSMPAWDGETGKVETNDFTDWLDTNGNKEAGPATGIGTLTYTGEADTIYLFWCGGGSDFAAVTIEYDE
jgi:hypothetical protein